MSGGAAFSKSGNYSNQWSGQQTNFPLNYLSLGAGIYGAPINENALLAGMPQTSSLFGGQSVGIGPSGMYGGGAPQQYPQYGGGGGYGPSPQGSQGMGISANAYGGSSPVNYPGASSYAYGAPQQYAPSQYGGGGASYGAPSQGYGGGGMGPPFGVSQQQPQASQGQGAGGGASAPAGSISYGQLVAMLNQTGFTNASVRDQNERQLQSAMQTLGIDPSQPISQAQIQQLGQYEAKQGTPGGLAMGSTVLGQAQEYAGLQTPTNFSSSGTPAGLNVNAGLSNLGIGQLSAPIQAPTIGQAPTVNAPQAGAAQMNIAPSGFDAYQQQLYQQQFDPIQQQQAIQNAIANQQLNSDLASRGLASSGAGVGQMQLQRQQQAIQLNNASVQASNNASVQRFGAQYGQAQQNAQMQQQTALANAGMDQQAQITNAGNVLTGNIQNATAYLQAMGLTTAQAQNERADFLQTMGLQETDLQRMDSQQLSSLGLVLNNWLQQMAVVSQTGAVSLGRAGAGGESVSQSAGGGG